jgi:L-asparaginase
MSPLKIRVLAVGGTIDKVYFDDLSTYDVGEPQVQAVFQEANVAFEFVIESLLRKDSLKMTDEDRALIRQRVMEAPEERVLITHGTDTMTQTAAALADIAGKTIVMTGSMLPARFRASDAPFNLGCAVGALQSLPSGVYIAMNGRVFPAHLVRKNREKGVFELIAEATSES